MSVTMGTMFGAECVNCDADADVDVQVMDVETGEIVRDVFACNACEAQIDVGANFHVASEAL